MDVVDRRYTAQIARFKRVDKSLHIEENKIASRNPNGGSPELLHNQLAYALSKRSIE